MPGGVRGFAGSRPHGAYQNEQSKQRVGKSGEPGAGRAHTERAGKATRRSRAEDPGKVGTRSLGSLPSKAESEKRDVREGEFLTKTGLFLSDSDDPAKSGQQKVFRIAAGGNEPTRLWGGAGGRCARGEVPLGPRQRLWGPGGAGWSPGWRLWGQRAAARVPAASHPREADAAGGLRGTGWAPRASPARLRSHPPVGPRRSPYLAPDRGPGYRATAEEYRLKRIPEQAAASRSSSQRSWPRGSPMQPWPAGAPSAAVPGGGERPGWAGPASQRRPPCPPPPRPCPPPAPAAPPRPAAPLLPGLAAPSGAALAGPGGGRVAPRLADQPAPLRRCRLPRARARRAPVAGVWAGRCSPGGQGQARTDRGAWRGGRGAGRRRHLPGGPRSARSPPAPGALGRMRGEMRGPSPPWVGGGRRGGR